MVDRTECLVKVMESRTCNKAIVYVGVQCYPWFKFCFPLFWGMVIMIISLKTNRNRIWKRIKLNHSIIIIQDILSQMSKDHLRGQKVVLLLDVGIQLTVNSLLDDLA